MTDWPNRWTYEARVLRVVDADTLELRVDLGFQVHHVATARLLDCWAPELYSGSHRDLGRDAGLEVLRWLGAGSLELRAAWWQDREALHDYLGRDPDGPLPRRKGWHIDPRTRPRVVVRSHDGRRLGTGKYGRWLVEVLADGRPGTDPAIDSLNAHLVAEGLAWRTRQGMVDALRGRQS